MRTAESSRASERADRPPRRRSAIQARKSLARRVAISEGRRAAQVQAEKSGEPVQIAAIGVERAGGETALAGEMGVEGVQLRRQGQGQRV